MMDVMPIFHSGKLVGWAGAVCHELEAGGITPGGDVALAQERFTEGLFVCAEKIGENDEIRRDYVIRCERNLRMPIYWVLDEKAKVASCIDMRESVKALIDEIGLDYWMQVSKEFIEEGRRAQLARTRQLTVPGIYRGHTFYGHVTKGKPGYQPLGDPDWLYNIPIEMEITTDGKIIMDFEGTQPWGYHSMNCTPGRHGRRHVRDADPAHELRRAGQRRRLDGDRAEAAAGHLDQPRQRDGGDGDVHGRCCCRPTACSSGFCRAPSWRAVSSRRPSSARSTSPMIEMGGTSQYGTLFGMAHFECAAAGSGALAIKDGLDTAYVGWNPESDMGNIEVWEQSMPMLYIGRSIVPNSGGAGKYRGGCSLPVDLAGQQDRIICGWSRRSILRASSTMAACAAAIRRRPARSTARCATPTSSSLPRRSAAGAPHGHQPSSLGAGNAARRRACDRRGPYITAPHKTGDVFTHSYNGGGGYGDVLERDPVEDGLGRRERLPHQGGGRGVFGIVLDEDEEGYPGRRIWRPRSATAPTIAPGSPVAGAMPVSEWIAEERGTRRRRRLRARGEEDVRQRHASSRRASPGFLRFLEGRCQADLRGAWRQSHELLQQGSHRDLVAGHAALAADAGAS